MSNKTHVIRIERTGYAPRWVKHMAKGGLAECTVTFDQQQARRMTPDTAAAHAQRLTPTLRSHCFAITVEPAP